MSGTGKSSKEACPKLGNAVIVKRWDGETHTATEWPGFHKVCFLYRQLPYNVTNKLKRIRNYGRKKAIALCTYTARANLAAALRFGYLSQP